MVPEAFQKKLEPMIHVVQGQLIKGGRRAKEENTFFTGVA